MTIVFFLFLFAILFGFFRFYKTSLISLGVAILFLWLIGSGFLPAIFLRNLQQSSYFKMPVFDLNSNGIILLGGGCVKILDLNRVEPSIIGYSRILRSAQLYRKCKQHRSAVCHIIISGGDAGNGFRESDVYKKELLLLGISEADIITETQSKNTYQNAKYTAELLAHYHYHQLILVTSGLHMRRSLVYFANFNIKPIPFGSDYSKVYGSLLPISYNFTLFDWALHEYIGILRLKIYNYFGLNSPAV